MTTTPVLFYGINAAPPFNGPLTIGETTPGDVNTASFFDASNNPVNQGNSLGDYVNYGYVEIGESTSLSTDYFFLDGKFLGNTSDSTVSQVITDLKNAYTNDIVVELVQVEKEGAPITRDEMVVMVFLLLFAGHGDYYTSHKRIGF